VPNDARMMRRNNRKAGKWPELDAVVYDWYLAIYTLGHSRFPKTTALLQEGATMIAGRLDITQFSASHGWVRGFLKRFDICNVAMHGQAGEANLALAATTMRNIRRKLEDYPPDRKYSTDETGLLYRCLPSRSYVPRRNRPRARGTRAMRHMDRVTLVLCTNATSTHTLLVAMIGEPVNQLCFRGEGNECPLPYLNQEKAWTDKYVYAKWCNTVFLSAGRDRHGDAKCALIMDNSSTYDTALSADDVKISFLPPNVTAIYQPMDARVIAALKRRYKRRFLAVLVRWSSLSSQLQTHPSPPDPPLAMPATPPTPPPAEPPPPSPPPFLCGFRAGNYVL